MTDHVRGLAWGSCIGDALAMPVHWYYDRAALHRDYRIVRDYLGSSSLRLSAALRRGW